jgi:molybdenum cofactor biosynthesis enzyme MoaA
MPPYLREFLPEFIALTAQTALGTVIAMHDNAMVQLETLDKDSQLAALQGVRSSLDSVLKDYCAEANAISFINNPGYRETQVYHDMYRESSTFYTSPEFASAKGAALDIKLRIIQLHKEGTTNQDSFKLGSDGSQILKQVQSHFPDA